MTDYDALDRETLVRLLRRRDAERQLGLVWERDEIEADNAMEPKGAHLWGLESEVEKSTAVHPDYGRVFMVGRKRGERSFTFLRPLGNRLQSDGAFSIDRLRFV